MKKNITRMLFAFCIIGVTLVACNNDRDDGIASATLQLNFDLEEGTPLPETLTVRFTNFAESYVREVQVNPRESLDVFIDSLIPGVHAVFATAEYQHETGILVFSGSLPNVSIFEENTDLGELTVTVAPPGTLIFKQIFYSGSRFPSSEDGTPGATYMFDNFFEIFNNGSSTVFLDGVAITFIEPMSPTTNVGDWQEADSDYFVHAFHKVWQIPGSGTDYPLQPGESVVIATRNINHQAADINPNSPVDLSSAEFVTYTGHVNAVRGPNGIGMTMFALNPAQNVVAHWVPVIGGGAYIMFRQSGPIDPNNLGSRPGQNPRHLRILRSDVLDAVEGLANEAQRATHKRMPIELDAGSVVTTAFESEGVIRRVRDTREDGTPIFYDTNNSTYDFVVGTPQIRQHGARRPAWATW